MLHAAHITQLLSPLLRDLQRQRVKTALASPAYYRLDARLAGVTEAHLLLADVANAQPPIPPATVGTLRAQDIIELLEALMSRASDRHLQAHESPQTYQANVLIGLAWAYLTVVPAAQEAEAQARQQEVMHG
jgi:hypothetical protein